MNNSRIVLITGCSRGLGRAMVDGFIAEGDTTVVGCARSKKAIEELRAQNPAPHSFHTLDVRDPSAVEKFARIVIAEIGAPDLLINNAGIINRNAPLWEISAEEFSYITDININGVATMIRHFVPAMISNGTGVIVNLSSGWGRSTSPEVAPYCATKYAIEGLTAALAQELPDGLAAVTFNPGTIDTDMLRSCYGEGASAYPSAREWAKTAVPYLAKLKAKDNGRALTAP